MFYKYDKNRLQALFHLILASMRLIISKFVDIHLRRVHVLKF